MEFTTCYCPHPGIVFHGPLHLPVGEVVDLLEEQGTEVDAQREFAAQPPCALGSRPFEVGQDDVGEDGVLCTNPRTGALGRSPAHVTMSVML
jgi:hypothetical protein